MMDRKPRGYIGKNHETIGSDILSVFGVALPEVFLGPEVVARLKAVKPDEWYPIEMLLDPMDIIARKVGESGLRSMGRKLFQLSHEANVKKSARSVADILYAFDGIYHQANRGEGIGGWEVVSFEPGLAVLDKTTPHHCKMEEGLIWQALMAVGVPANVAQTRCFREGADSCEYRITSMVDGPSWGTAR